MAILRALLIGIALTVPAPAGAAPTDRWSHLVFEASRRFGVPAEWIRRVIAVESAGRTGTEGRLIVSRAGAMGLMQLMPGTWSDMRSVLGLGTDPFDPRDNILAGSLYLRLMYDRFGYPGLFGAYNAGPQRYAASLAHTRSLPVETRTYVAKLTASGASGRTNLSALRGRSTHTDRSVAPGNVPQTLFIELSIYREAFDREGGEGRQGS